MKNKISVFLVSIALGFSMSASVSAANSGAGGFGQTFCKLPSGEKVFIPSHQCKILLGKGNPADL